MTSSRRVSRTVCKVGAAGALAIAALGPVAGPGLAQDPVTLQIWSPENRPDDAAAHAWLIEQFKAANPGIDVQLTTTSWDDHFAKIDAAAAADNLPDIALVFEVAKVTVGGVTTFYFPGDAIRIPAGASATIILNAGTNATSENLLDYVINVSWPWGHTLDMADDTDHLGDPVMFSFTGADTPPCKLCSP